MKKPGKTVIPSSSPVIPSSSPVIPSSSPVIPSEARDLPFEADARVRASFAKQHLMRTIGAVLEEVAPGRVAIRLPFREDLTQQHGFLHAGTIAAVADSACGYAALTLMPTDAAVLSIEFKVNMLAPARGDSIVARAEVIRSGRTIVVCRADVSALNEGQEKLVAAMQGTMMVVTGRNLSD